MFGGPGGAARLLGGETLKPKNTSETLRRFAGYFRPFWPMLLLVGVLVVISTWTQVTSPELLGQAVDCYLSPAQGAGGFAGLPGAAGPSTAQPANTCWYDPAASGSLSNDARLAGLGGILLRLLGLYALGAVATGLTFYVMSWSGQHVLKDLRVAVFKHLHRLSLGYYSENEAGDLMSRITNDSDTIQQAISFALINVLSGILLLIWIAYNMLNKNIGFALISLSMAPFMFIATRWFSAQARKAFRKTRTAIGDVNAELQQSIAGVREVQAFSREGENIQAFRGVNAANRDANIRAVTFTSALAPTLEALGYVAMALVAGVGGYLVLRDQPFFGASVSLGLVITFIAYVQRFNQPIQQIAVLWTNIQSAIAGGERIFGLLDVVPDVKNKPGARPMPPITGTVELVDVHLEYEKGVPVLRGVSFRTEPGQMVAIVGPTGAGKTTIINLLPRFYDVVGGAVKIDGIDVRDVDAQSLRRQIGIVLQDSFLFSDTIKNNIRYGRPNATDEEVIAAAKLARADQFIERLPEGYDTQLGERGSGLSQGQRQLLAIARAALADPRILILDEATSSVDTRTERLIQEALEKLLAGRTSFVVAHRLSTVRKADQILVLRDGQIVERGKYDELLAQKGFFYELHNSQFRREEPTPGTGPSFQPALMGGNGTGNGRVRETATVT